MNPNTKFLLDEISKLFDAYDAKWDARFAAARIFRVPNSKAPLRAVSAAADDHPVDSPSSCCSTGATSELALSVGVSSDDDLTASASTIAEEVFVLAEEPVTDSGSASTAALAIDVTLSDVVIEAPTTCSRECLSTAVSNKVQVRVKESNHYLFDGMPRRYITYDNPAYLVGVDLQYGSITKHEDQVVFGRVTMHDLVLFGPLLRSLVDIRPWPPPHQHCIILPSETILLCFSLQPPFSDTWVMVQQWPSVNVHDLVTVWRCFELLGRHQWPVLIYHSCICGHSISVSMILMLPISIQVVVLNSWSLPSTGATQYILQQCGFLVLLQVGQWMGGDACAFWAMMFVKATTKQCICYRSVCLYNQFSSVLHSDILSFGLHNFPWPCFCGYATLVHLKKILPMVVLVPMIRVVNRCSTSSVKQQEFGPTITIIQPRSPWFSFDSSLLHRYVRPKCDSWQHTLTLLLDSGIIGGKCSWSGVPFDCGASDHSKHGLFLGVIQWRSPRPPSQVIVMDSCTLLFDFVIHPAIILEKLLVSDIIHPVLHLTVILEKMLKIAHDSRCTESGVFTMYILVLYIKEHQPRNPDIMVHSFSCLLLMERKLVWLPTWTWSYRALECFRGMLFGAAAILPPYMFVQQRPFLIRSNEKYSDEFPARRVQIFRLESLLAAGVGHLCFVCNPGASAGKPYESSVLQCTAWCFFEGFSATLCTSVIIIAGLFCELSIEREKEIQSTRQILWDSGILILRAGFLALIQKERYGLFDQQGDATLSATLAIVFRLHVRFQTASGFSIHVDSCLSRPLWRPDEMLCTWTIVVSYYKPLRVLNTCYIPSCDQFMTWDPGTSKILHRLGGKPKLKKGGMSGYQDVLYNGLSNDMGLVGLEAHDGHEGNMKQARAEGIGRSIIERESRELVFLVSATVLLPLNLPLIHVPLIPHQP